MFNHLLSNLFQPVLLPLPPLSLCITLIITLFTTLFIVTFSFTSPYTFLLFLLFLPIPSYLPYLAHSSSLFLLTYPPFTLSSSHFLLTFAQYTLLVSQFLLTSPSHSLFLSAMSFSLFLTTSLSLLQTSNLLPPPPHSTVYSTVQYGMA